jgi:hypothetical protein
MNETGSNHKHPHVVSVKPAVDNDRGATYNVVFDEPIEQVTVVIGYDSNDFGNHFHTGANRSKSPEKVFVAYGEGMLHTLDLRNGKEEEYIKPVKQGDLWTIEHGIYHELHTDTNMVFLERLYIPYDHERDKADTIQGI